MKILLTVKGNETVESIYNIDTLIVNDVVGELQDKVEQNPYVGLNIAINDELYVIQHSKIGEAYLLKMNRQPELSGTSGTSDIVGYKIKENLSLKIIELIEKEPVKWLYETFYF